LCILIFTYSYLDSRRENKMIWTEW
jgi:hypothetical protein